MAEINYQYGEAEEHALVDNDVPEEQPKPFAWYRDVPVVRQDGELCPQCGHTLSLPDGDKCADRHCDTCGFSPAFMSAQGEQELANETGVEHFDGTVSVTFNFFTYHLILLLFALLIFFTRLDKDGQSPWLLVLIVTFPALYIMYVCAQLALGMECHVRR